MIIQGKIIKLYGLNASNVASAIGGEANSSLTIDTDTIRSASNTARCTNVHAGMKSWSISGECYYKRESFVKMWQWMTDASKNPTVQFKGYQDGHMVSLTGSVVFTNIHVSAGVHDTIRVSYSAQGNGKPTIIIE